MEQSVAGTTFTPGTTMNRTASPFGLFDDERPASKRATRDAIVRLTRLSTPDLEEIANRGGHAEDSFLSQQTTSAATDALEGLIGSERMSRSGGGRQSRHNARANRGAGSSTLGSTTRPLSGVSRPVSNQEGGSWNGSGDSGGEGLIGKAIDEEFDLRQRPDTPPTPLLTPRGGGSEPLAHSSPSPLGANQTLRFGTRQGGGGGQGGSHGMGGRGLGPYHTGSADTLPSKARALLDRHSFYSAGVRAFDNQRPRDFTVLPGEHRSIRASKGSPKVFRMRPVLPSRAPGEDEVEVVPGELDRTGEFERLLKVKQLIKMVIVGTGAAASASSSSSSSSSSSGGGGNGRALLERSFRLADKDGSGELTFDEMNFCLSNDFAIKGLTPGDMRRLFASLDEDGSGLVNSEEFVRAIDDTPLPEFKHKVGYQVMPTPQNLKVRQAFQVWPLRVDVGVFHWRGTETKRAELTVRNVGYAECRFRVHVCLLDPALGQEAVVVEQPRGLVAPGLRRKVVVEFTSRDKGSLTCLISLETADQVAEIPIVGYCSDGQELYDEIHAKFTGANCLPLVMSPVTNTSARGGCSGAGGRKGSGSGGKGGGARGGGIGGGGSSSSSSSSSSTVGIMTVAAGEDGWFGETKSDLASSLSSAVTWAPRGGGEDGGGGRGGGGGGA